MEKFDEYKLLSERIQQMSERRQAATQTYLTVNTAIFGIMAFLVKDIGLCGWGLVLINLPLFVVGGIACWVWYRIIGDFRVLIGWHYEQLRKMEEVFPEDSRVYLHEWKEFYEPRNGRKRFGFSRLEGLLPRLFIGLYLAYGIGLVMATALGWL